MRLLGLLLLTGGAFGAGMAPSPWLMFTRAMIGLVGFAIALQADRRA